MTYHARFTLDHEALVLVHPADAADDVVVLVVRAAVVGVVAIQRIRAVRLAGRLAYDLVDLHGGLVACAVVRLPQPVDVAAQRGLSAVVPLWGSRGVGSGLLERATGRPSACYLL